MQNKLFNFIIDITPTRILCPTTSKSHDTRYYFKFKFCAPHEDKACMFLTFKASRFKKIYAYDADKPCERFHSESVRISALVT